MKPDAEQDLGHPATRSHSYGKVKGHMYRICVLMIVLLFIDQYYVGVSNKQCSLPLCLPVSSADDLCKQFGPRSGLTKCQA